MTTLFVPGGFGWVVVSSFFHAYFSQHALESYPFCAIQDSKDPKTMYLAPVCDHCKELIHTCYGHVKSVKKWFGLTERQIALASNAYVAYLYEIGKPLIK